MRSVASGLYLLFVLTWFTHLSERFAVLGLVRFDLLLVVVIFVLLMASSDDSTDTEARTALPASNGTDRTRRAIIVLLVYAILEIPFVEWPGSVVNKGLPSFVKALVFYFFTAGLITSEARLKRLMWVFIAAMTFRVIEPVFLHVTTGYWGSFAYLEGDTMDRLSGAPFDVINPNGLALVILTVIPFLHYLGPLTVIGRLAYVCLLPILLWALMLTGSRSGLLGLGAVLLMIWLKSRRKVLLAVVAAVGVAIVIPTLSDSLTDRYLSIVDSNTKNAKTAEGRLAGTIRDLQVAMRRPIFGHGLGTSMEANANFGNEDQPSHNLYTEAAQEIGFVGLAILLYVICSIVWSFSVSVRALRQVKAPGSFPVRLADAAQVWLAMYILFSFASYGLSSYELYFAAGLSEVARRMARGSRVESEASENLPGSSVTKVGRVEVQPVGHPMLAPMPSKSARSLN